MAVLLSDNFNRADTVAGAVGNPQIGPAPTYPTAGLRINSNQLTGTGGGSIAWNVGTPNVEISAATTGLSVSTNFAQVRIGEGGPEGTLTFSVNSHSHELYIGLLLIWTRSLAVQAYSPVIKMSYRDRVARCYSDDVLVYRAVLDYPITGGVCAVRTGTSNVRLDNVLAVDSPVVDEFPLLAGSHPTTGFLSAASIPPLAEPAFAYLGRDTKTLDQAPGA